MLLLAGEGGKNRLEIGQSKVFLNQTCPLELTGLGRGDASRWLQPSMLGRAVTAAPSSPPVHQACGAQSRGTGSLKTARPNQDSRALPPAHLIPKGLFTQCLPPTATRLPVNQKSTKHGDHFFPLASRTVRMTFFFFFTCHHLLKNT